MKRFQVLDRDTQVFGWFFLEASAGTGKTFAIEHIVVRTILESNPPIPIEKILIVTFTRAATRELKVRIRNNLTKTLLFLQQGNSGPDYLQPIFEKDSSEIFSAKRKIEEALCNFDKANVFTLHGFCHKILSEFAFEAGEFLELDSPESRSHSLKILQVVEDYFRAGIDTKRFSPAQIDLLITSKPSEACRVIKKIAQSIEKDVHIEDFLCWSELIECFNSHLIDVSAKFDFIKERYDSDMALLFPLFKKIKSFHKNEADSLFNILKKQQITEKEFANVIQSKEYFLSLLCDDNLKKGKDPYKLKLFYPELRNLCIERFLPLIEQASDKEKIFLRLTSECLKSWKSSSLYQESFSPDDLLRKMAGALKKDFLKEKISEKFIVGIIDEFQDTDPIQWEIFRSLFLSKDQLIKTIYLVDHIIYYAVHMLL
jgi:exodeoxyribonuclease V beta subunit